jgi:hypothetical protein
MIVPMEIVSALLGHSKMSLPQDPYAKIVNKKIATSMVAFLKEVLNRNFSVAY